MTLTAQPVSFNAARDWIRQHHRHHPAIVGWLFGVQILDDGVRVGVAACGRPARMLQDGVTCEIVRVASLPGSPNACSFAYGRLRSASAALGYRRVVTYTRPDESGASLRGAGFRFAGVSRGGEWSRAERARAAARDPGPKLRWVWYADPPRCTCPPPANVHATACAISWLATSESDARALLAQEAP